MDKNDRWCSARQPLRFEPPGNCYYTEQIRKTKSGFLLDFYLAPRLINQQVGYNFPTAADKCRLVNVNDFQSNIGSVLD